MDEPEFGYEERSKRLIERLDRIRNYLQNLPPLPKFGTADSSNRVPNKEEVLDAVNVESEGRPDSICSDDETSTRQLSISTKSHAVPKDDTRSELLQQSQSPKHVLSPEMSQSSGVQSQSPKQVSSPEMSLSRVQSQSPKQMLSPEMSQSSRLQTPSSTSADTSSSRGLKTMKQKKKPHKKKRDMRIQDPLRPTDRQSFGVDIGQGINTITYIKQNTIPGSETRCQRLINIITKEVKKDLHTERSLDRLYRQPPLPETSIPDKITRWSDSSKNRALLGSPSGMNKLNKSSVIYPNQSEVDIYRVRYLDRATELPHHHGLDALQELFVPYLEHKEKEQKFSSTSSDRL